MNRASEIKQKMKLGNLSVIGGHVFYNDPAISNAMAYSGYDFLWIDAEHGTFSKQDILLHTIAANEGGAAAFVRVASSDPNVIKPVLEMGIDGIIIPMIMDEKQAAAAIKACLYPPEGIRGFGPRRSDRFGMIDTSEYLSASRDSFLRIIQIEHINSVRAIEKILLVDGLDAIIIGPNDLAASIGLIGQPSNSKVLAMGGQVINAAKKAGIAVGVSVGPRKETIELWAENGVDFISSGDDVTFIRDGARGTIDFVSNLGKKTRHK